ncbi:FAD-dependent oxidoreductase [Desertimonas flava]|uniref:NAD(P)/FAD-dependent oxidoreductase n=1 Tax=Desertimonas flava TaxID=2064846 RepID=UPI000E351CA5
MTDRPASTRVVVLGGGYAGTMAANRLRTRADIAVTLINPRAEFVERIPLHQLVAGNDDAVADYDQLLGAGIALIVDAAVRIDTDRRVVELLYGAPLSYDFVIYAVGSTAEPPASIPGAREFAYPVAELEHARRLRVVVADLPPGAAITVVGAGLTGIETASELAENGYRVTLVCGGQLGPYLSTRGRRSVAKVLRKLGVHILEAPAVTKVTADAVVLSDGSEHPTSVTIWTAGFAVPALAAASGLRTDDVGRLLTDETLTSIDDDRVLAAGDSASPSGVPLRMSCQMAGPLGMTAAETVLSRVAGTTPAVIDQASFGACVSLGRRSGIVQFAHKDDRAIDLSSTGRLVAPIKEAVCRSTLWSLRREARRPGSAFWFKGGRRPAAAVPDAPEQEAPNLPLCGRSAGCGPDISNLAAHVEP